MPISREQVIHVATLARLGLSEDEIGLFAGQLGSILDHIASLGELDVSSIPPAAQVIPLTNVMRPDESRPSLPTDAVLANAPRAEDGLFRVAPVFEEA
jgi:aspartyl-tRNA(Asn)/glutamyl-tRNA(Gln) amidotransferase subunit C